MARSGLHARPASLLSRAASASGHRILLGREGEVPVDAASVLMVMGLGLEHGDEVVLSADDDGAEAALVELAEMLGTDLDAAAASG